MKDRRELQPNKPGIEEKQASNRIRDVIGSERIAMHIETQRPTKAVMRALRGAAKRGAIV